MRFMSELTWTMSKERITEYLINTQYYDIFFVIGRRPDEIRATEI